MRRKRTLYVPIYHENTSFSLGSGNHCGCVKVIILGNHSVGKSTLIHRYVHSNCSFNQKPTLGATFVSKKITRGRQNLVLYIWDTAGTERYRAMMQNYYRNAKAAIVCYDITNKVSWDVLRSWVSEIRNREENCRIYICGTKKDLVDDGIAPCEVTIENVNFYAQTCGIGDATFVTSSKTGENVDAIFTKIADDLWDETLQNKVNNTRGTFVIGSKPPKKSCCS